MVDECQVARWRHHYRAHNTTADWLANWALDTKTSLMIKLEDVNAKHPVRKGAAERIGDDSEQWIEEERANA